MRPALSNFLNIGFSIETIQVEKEMGRINNMCTITLSVNRSNSELHYRSTGTLNKRFHSLQVNRKSVRT